MHALRPFTVHSVPAASDASAVSRPQPKVFAVMAQREKKDAVSLELTNSTRSPWWAGRWAGGGRFVPPDHEFFYLGILDSVFEDSVFSRSELSESNYCPSTSWLHARAAGASKLQAASF
jgi:hypothetical protein